MPILSRRPNFLNFSPTVWRCDGEENRKHGTRIEQLGCRVGKLVLLVSMIAIAVVILHDATTIQTGLHLPSFDKGIIKSVVSHVGGQETDAQSNFETGASEEDADTDTEHDMQSPSKNDCLALPGADKVLIILKTGATVVYERLPIHFETTFTCVPNFLIISDLGQTVGQTPTHDVISMVREETRSSNEDFKLYNEIQKFYRDGQDVGLLNPELSWNLDKWKFLPMIHKVWETASDDIEWFVMMEADTSLSWLNLLLWLQTMDPKKPLYLGSPTILLTDNSKFAHGGSGVVMSRAAIERVETARQNTEGGVEAYDARWEEQTAKVCCGDAVLAQAFYEVGVNVTRASPLIQGETPLTLKWSADNWCAPTITWHHVGSAEVDSIWQFQSEWVQEHGWEEPYLYRDVFEQFVQPHIRANRTDWDNLSKWVVLSVDDESYHAYDQKDQAATQTVDDCVVACQRRRECMQWKWTPDKCFLDERITYGLPVHHEVDSPHCTSGWLQDRVAGFKESQLGCGFKWPG